MSSYGISSSLEDYLEAIAELVELNGHAHTKDIAERLKIKMPSVTNALQSLASRGLIVYQSHSPVTLTASGALRAAIIRNKHVAMRVFFSEILKLDPEETDDAACKIEHVIGEKVMSRLVFLAEAITSRQDCESLRSFLDEIMPQLHSDEDDELIPLSELDEGQRAIVGLVSDSLKGKKKFAELGLVRGTLLQMEGRAPFGDLLRIKVLCCSLSLRAKDASQIWVKPTKDLV